MPLRTPDESLGWALLPSEVCSPLLLTCQRRSCGDRFNTERSFGEPFERAQDAAMLGKDGIVHLLRHTYILRLIMAGADVRTVQELTGHKTIGMTMRYALLASEHKRRVIGLLDVEVTAKVTTVDFT